MKLYIRLCLLLSLIFLASCSWETTSIMQSWEDTNLENMTQSEDIVTDATSINSNSQETMNSPYVQENNSFTFTTENGTTVEINPISHATMIVNWGDTTMYIDPAEAVESYSDFADPNVVLVTHEHGDHFNLEVLQSIVTDGVQLVVNPWVYDMLTPELQEGALVMSNWDNIELAGYGITAIPAYNVREEALNYHPEGRDNGYIIEQDDFRVYISWDTEDTPEMRVLENIDIAFVSMNLPFTMPVDSAIDGILEFAPKTVFPYHFRGQDGMSDVERLKTEIEAWNSDIQVVLADWYAE